ncbi:MAG: response regulator [Fidelibacterota bacterium]|nr:MAG: response regulator [Candidatus Neomarinimicrobiota bacterium]
MALILIIDDSSYQRIILRDMLRAAGYHTIEATDGQEGLDMLTGYTPDCVVTDLLMPRMGGLELLEVMKKQGTAIPTIIVTSSRQSGVREQCLALGAAAFLNKPVEEGRLVPVVRKVIEESTQTGDRSVPVTEA